MGFADNGTKVVAAIAVCAILILSILVPFVSNAGTVEKRFDVANEGTPLIQGDVSQDYNIQWDSALPGMVKINPKQLTVTFSAGQDATVSPASKTVAAGLTYGELPIPVRTGYTFGGWFTSTSYTTEVTEETIVGNTNVILYAKWTANTYTVTFDADGGTVSPATKTVTFGSAYGELPVPEYTGYNFGGWFDENDNPITAATIVSIADDHTLTAKWTAEQYLISFTTDGKGTVDVASLTADYGTAYTISGNTVIIDGTTVTATGTGLYVFDSWTPSTSGTITGATVFIASFSEPSATLSFSAQSPGSVSTAQITNVPIGTQYTVVDNVVTIMGETPVTATLPDGYYMIGWSEPQGVGTVSGDMTFTAQYEVIEIAKVGCSTTTTWVLTTDGKLFGCGANNNGQQGDGTTTDVTIFTQRLESENIKDISVNASETFVVTTDGKLFGCGANNNGQQGNGTSGTSTNVTTFTQRLTTETIDFVHTLGGSTFVVTTDGKLFGCGANSFGQQGDGTTTKVTTFTQRLEGENVKTVFTGQTTWVLTTDGKLFGCGRNSSGNQGNGTTTDVKTFTQRLTNETIGSFVCGDSETWAVTTDGKLFGCGSSSGGQQGSGDTTNVTSFTQRLTNETISSIAAGSSTTWAVTTDGKLFGCGRNQFGQQGDGTTSDVTTFTQRLTNETISSVKAPSGITWALTTDGKLFGCGRNNNDQQGDGTTSDVTSFTQRLTNETISSIAAGSSTTWAVTTDSKLFGCGWNNYGQQGSGDTTNVTTFTQRGPPGAVNIPAQISPQMQSLNSPRFSPAPMLLLNSVSPASIVGTDYTFHAGGTGWLLCTVSVGQDQYALALFSSSLQSPLLWDEDAALLFSNGTMTCENDGVTYTMTYTDIYFEGNGGYVLTTGAANVKDDTNIIAFSVPSPGEAVQVTGTLDDLTAAVLSGSSSAGAVTATSEDTDYEEIKNVTEISAEYGSSSAVCSSIIVPNKVTTIIEVDDEVMGTLLSIVPMVTIVGLILAVLGTFMFKRQ